MPAYNSMLQRIPREKQDRELIGALNEVQVLSVRIKEELSKIEEQKRARELEKAIVIKCTDDLKELFRLSSESLDKLKVLLER